MNAALLSYSLHLADTALIAGHRNSEWTGHGPILEQDIALSNIALDQIGQARFFYQYAARICNTVPTAQLPSVTGTEFCTPVASTIGEDDLAYFRDARDYLNLLLVELPDGDWGQTILKQFLLAAYQHCLFDKLAGSSDPDLAAIAVKSLKEITYHLRWSGEWVIRLGDGTTESHARMTRAMELLWRYTGELFLNTPYETELAAQGITVAPETIRQPWSDKVLPVLQRAGLNIPEGQFLLQTGKLGQHTEHLGYLLAEMQFLQRAYPGNEW
ncbi:1,2-phenylacetyl-CoA epoxidase subunit PaaC [Flavihumibacter petaseus]|uniref:Phenylacetyl-CoA oxygenase subunit PaaC n=1 Tax=Flavihumibacter petaseus NBRC 106054 TaxID=1220578 RepID=A0A0E9MX61_9BACT|nr:1,2-phenylacetyl-CoA epoxidase subunit PaaC [Flavihumibacter petaseus]GAO42001.1 phenylacetyl-CoA oxygenase subunit PaaC [Flavihumibacter petaseus NBRC 106054]